MGLGEVRNLLRMMAPCRSGAPALTAGAIEADSRRRCGLVGGGWVASAATHPPGCLQPLIPEEARPSMTRFCMVKKRMKIGAMAMVEAAIMSV